MPHLEPLWAGHEPRRLVEPFVGGLAVTLGLQPERALLNDINPHLINFYRWVAKGLLIDIPMENDLTLYYGHRARFNFLIQSGLETSAEAAMLFYYLNRTGYNGLCRFNKSGQFNVPFGRYNRIPYVRDFSVYQPYLSSWQFAHMSFDTLPLYAEDFVYADPPYDVEFRHYSAGGFAWADQVRLAEWLAVHSGPVVLSNQATERVVALYRRLGFTLIFLDAPRRISRNGDRTPAREVVAMRNLGEWAS